MVSASESDQGGPGVRGQLQDGVLGVLAVAKSHTVGGHLGGFHAGA